MSMMAQHYIHSTTLFEPIFTSLQRVGTSGASMGNLEPGRGGSTRDMGHFPETHPKLVDFRRYLESVDGSCKSSKVLGKSQLTSANYSILKVPKNSSGVIF